VGAILHTSGDGIWSTQTLGSGVTQSSGSAELWGVWGSGSGDVYVVGENGIMHSTGNGSWDEQQRPVGARLYAIWGSGAADVYAVGQNGTILHHP
jgi:hypothetical protein